jgi:hypothetical protein
LTTELPSGLEIPSDAETKLLRFAKEEFAYYDGIDDLLPTA